MSVKKLTKPEPVAVSTICSVCGLPWSNHGKDPTTDDCIRLLKAELASRSITIPAYPTYPFPWYREEPSYIKITNREPYEITYGGRTEKAYGLQECTPRILDTPCNAVSSLSS